MPDLADDYRALVNERKQCTLCKGLSNPSRVANGIHDSDEIGPWTTWQGKLGARIMLVGQDYSDVQYFLKNGGREKHDNPTALALVRLMQQLGVALTPPGRDGGGKEVFLTNAILCLKKDGMQSDVQPLWFRNCQSFLRRQVEIVSPRVVITMGAYALRSALAAFGLRKMALATAVGLPHGIELPNGSQLFAVYHCGKRVQNGTRPLELQLADWRRIAAALKE